MRDLRCALAFLTRLPVGSAAFDGADVGRSTVWFPVVGLLVGAIQWLTLTALSPWLPTAVAATLTVATMAVVTGAFHLDALADTVDGLGGGWTRDRALEIMRDSVIGAYGAVALVLALGLRIFALSRLVELDRALPWVVVAPALAKWSTAALGYALPYARRTGGLGSAVTDHVGRAQVLGTSLAVVTIAAGLLGIDALPALAVVVAIALGMGRMCRRRIGGITGDTLGATAELTELGLLVLGLALEASR